MTTKPNRAKPLSENAVVPNGTPLPAINNAVEFWLTKYRKFGKAGATGFIEQCRAIALAEEELSAGNFERFCLELKLDFSDTVSMRLSFLFLKTSPFFRKMKKIGLEADRLKRAGEQIPNSLTPLYHLAKMKKADFDRILATGKLHSAITERELSDLSGQK